MASHRQRIRRKIRDFCERRDLTDWDEVLTDWLQKLLQTRIRLPDASGEMTLAGLSKEDYQPELEFLLASHGVDALELDDAVTAAIVPAASRPRLRENTFNGMLKGYIDLVFYYRGPLLCSGLQVQPPGGKPGGLRAEKHGKSHAGTPL